MKEKFERFKNEKIVVNVRSQKQYDDFMKMCEEQGLKWGSGSFPTQESYYIDYKENTCINLNNLKELYFCDINSYKNDGYKIITYEDFMKKSNQFTKSDLKDNHIVVQRNADKWVWESQPINACFKLDLTHEINPLRDIVEVYEFDKLVWKREEKPVEILDKVERNYLKKVINPWKDKVEYITKKKSFDYDDTEYLKIECTEKMSVWNVLLPYFEVNTMYKGMELNKEYTLAELGLED